MFLIAVRSAAGHALVGKRLRGGANVRGVDDLAQLWKCLRECGQHPVVLVWGRLPPPSLINIRVSCPDRRSRAEYRPASVQSVSCVNYLARQSWRTTSQPVVEWGMPGVSA